MANIKYIPLKKKFIKNGFTFSEVKRIKNFAIYKKQKTKKIFTYEVIYINTHNGYEIAGNKIEPSEVYPCTNEWGWRGYTFLELDSAEKKLNQMLKEKEKLENSIKTQNATKIQNAT